MKDEQTKPQYTTPQKLQIIADVLNKRLNQTIDFNKYQCRCYLAYDYNTKSIMQLINASQIKTGGVIYCLHQDFKKIAIDRIGEQELEKYLKE